MTLGKAGPIPDLYEDRTADAFYLFNSLPAYGATKGTLIRRAVYGGRKGRAALRRLRAMGWGVTPSVLDTCAIEALAMYTMAFGGRLDDHVYAPLEEQDWEELGYRLQALGGPGTPFVAMPGVPVGLKAVF